MEIKDKKTTAIIFTGLIIIAGVVVYAFLKDDSSNNFSDISAGLNSAEVTNETLEGVSADGSDEDASSQAGSRDEMRLQEVEAIQSALQKYLDDNGHYPSGQDEIVPDYLSEWPEDPLPEEYEYNYTCIGTTDPCVFYDLSYTLEVGTDELPAGLNYVSPDEIAQ